MDPVHLAVNVEHHHTSEALWVVLYGGRQVLHDVALVDLAGYPGLYARVERVGVEHPDPLPLLLPLDHPHLPPAVGKDLVVAPQEGFGEWGVVLFKVGKGGRVGGEVLAHDDWVVAVEEVLVLLHHVILELVEVGCRRGVGVGYHGGEGDFPPVDDWKLVLGGDSGCGDITKWDGRHYQDDVSFADSTLC